MFARNIDIKFIFTYLIIGFLHKELFFCSNFDKEFYFDFIQSFLSLPFISSKKSE